MNCRKILNLSALAAPGLALLLAPAWGQESWESQRQAAYSEWKAAHSNLEADIAKLKGESAKLVAAVQEPVTVRQVAPPVIWRVPGAIGSIWDDPFAPEMVVIPAGEFTMGSPASEPGHTEAEGPQHRVRMAYPFAVGKTDVTLGEFKHFVAETHYDAKSGPCSGWTGEKTESSMNFNYETPGFPQTDNDSAVCIGLEDAHAYATWLSNKTGQHYRLLSEAEYEYATRGGTTTAYYWGDALGSGHANCRGCGGPWDHKQTAPAGTFPPNAFGLYDMVGNLWQWVEDCWNPNYEGAPTDGSAWLSGECDRQVRRGSAWSQTPDLARSAARIRHAPAPNLRVSSDGFRLARTL